MEEEYYEYTRYTTTEDQPTGYQYGSSYGDSMPHYGGGGGYRDDHRAYSGGYGGYDSYHTNNGGGYDTYGRSTIPAPTHYGASAYDNNSRYGTSHYHHTDHSDRYVSPTAREQRYSSPQRYHSGGGMMEETPGEVYEFYEKVVTTSPARERPSPSSYGGGGYNTYDTYSGGSPSYHSSYDRGYTSPYQSGRYALSPSRRGDHDEYRAGGGYSQYDNKYDTYHSPSRYSAGGYSSEGMSPMGSPSYGGGAGDVVEEFEEYITTTTVTTY